MLVIVVIASVLEEGPDALIVHSDSLSCSAERTQAWLSAPGLPGPRGPSQGRDGLLGASPDGIHMCAQALHSAWQRY